MNLPPCLVDPLDHGAPLHGSWGLLGSFSLGPQKCESSELVRPHTLFPQFRGNVWGQELRLEWPGWVEHLSHLMRVCGLCKPPKFTGLQPLDCGIGRMYPPQSVRYYVSCRVLEGKMELQLGTPRPEPIAVSWNPDPSHGQPWRNICCFFEVVLVMI